MVQSPCGKSKEDEAKKAAKDAKEINKEQPVGGVLKEYKDRIADVYKIVTGAKNTLVNKTGTIAEKDFRLVNDLIAVYNRNAGEFNNRASNAGLDSVPTIASVTPSDLKGKLDSDKAASKGKYDVWVFKMENGNWAKQEDRTLATDDAEQARDYMEKVKAVEGWTATTNLPDEKAAIVANTTWTGTGYEKKRTVIRITATEFALEVFGDDGTSITEGGAWTRQGDTITGSYDWYLSSTVGRKYSRSDKGSDATRTFTISKDGQTLTYDGFVFNRQ
jgi:hypothetical protein